MGGIYGCGCKEVYRLLHIVYPYSSYICSFLQQRPSLLFVHFFFFFLIKDLYAVHKPCYVLSCIITYVQVHVEMAFHNIPHH